MFKKILFKQEEYIYFSTPQKKLVKIPVKYFCTDYLKLFKRNERWVIKNFPFSYPTLLWIRQRLKNNNNNALPENPLEAICACSYFLQHDLAWEI